MFIAVDFDGTMVDHEYPEIGSPVPEALHWVKKFQEAGAQIILWTMRSGQTLDDAVKYMEASKIKLYGINRNPSQDTWTDSPKAYAHIYIDDAAFGCPLHVNPRMDGRPYVDWSIVGPKVLERLVNKKKG